MDWQHLIVWILIATASVGLLVAAAKSVRALLRGKCASRCSGCANANEATVPHDPGQARIVFLPAGNLRNSARDAK